MANAHNGEVSFSHEGETYTLRFSTNALCEMEGMLGDSIMNIAARMGDENSLRVSTMRTMFWAALRDRHKGLSEEDAGNLMDAIGMGRAFELTGKAFALAFPEEKGGPLGEKGKPGK